MNMKNLIAILVSGLLSFPVLVLYIVIIVVVGCTWYAGQRLRSLRLSEES